MIDFQINAASALTWLSAFLSIVGIVFTIIALLVGMRLQEVVRTLDNAVDKLYSRAIDQVFNQQQTMVDNLGSTGTPTGTRGQQPVSEVAASSSSETATALDLGGAGVGTGE